MRTAIAVLLSLWIPLGCHAPKQLQNAQQPPQPVAKKERAPELIPRTDAPSATTQDAAPQKVADEFTREGIESFIERELGDRYSALVHLTDDSTATAVLVVGSGTFLKGEFETRLLKITFADNALSIASQVVLMTTKGWRSGFSGALFGRFSSEKQQVALIHQTTRPEQAPQTEDDPDPCTPHKVLFDLLLFTAEGKPLGNYRIGSTRHRCADFEGHGMSAVGAIQLGTTKQDGLVLSEDTDGNHSWNSEITVWQIKGKKLRRISKLVTRVHDTETNIDEGTLVVGDQRLIYKRGRFVKAPNDSEDGD